MVGPAYVLERSATSGASSLRLAGRLTLSDVDRFWSELKAEAPARADRLALDVSELEDVDGAAVSVLLAARAEWRAVGGDVEFVGAREGVENLLELYGCPGGVECLQPPPVKEGLFDHLGRSTIEFLHSVRSVMSFVGELVHSFVLVVRHPRSLNWSAVPRLMERVGADGAPIVLLINLLIGMIIALQAAGLLSRFGAQRFAASLVGLSMTRELAPLMTAIVVAGRSGAAFAAELGSMRVSEEIDALETLGLDPQRFLVFPRVLALVCVMPLLTLLSDVMGILGGLVIGVTSLSLTPQVFMNALAESLALSDVVTGIVKSVFFAITITFISCQRGLATSGGATGVGEATTKSVVAILFALIVQDAVFTVLFDFLGV